MSRPCMLDPYEECFEDCPNCPRSIFLKDDYDADFEYEKQREERED